MNILLFGASSAIAQACARRWAAQGASLVLVGRNAQRLADQQADLQLRGAPAVHTLVADLDLIDDHDRLLRAAQALLGRLDVVLLAQGSLPEQRACEASVPLTLAALHNNGVAPLALAARAAQTLAAQKSGTLAVIGSVAGDRGRQSNFVYGAAKGLLDRYLQGLRNRLHGEGVQVLTIKPGFVDTPMTAAIQPKGALWAQPDAVAQAILKAIERRQDVLYVPGFWRLIMTVIRWIPESLFKRLKL
jgi:hypothetical protein